MNSLSVPRSAGQIRYLVAQALSWWLSELSALLPEAVRQLAGSVRPAELVLHFGSDRSTLTHGGQPGFGSATIPLNPESRDPSPSVQRQYAKAKVRILLNEDTVFHCQAQLPAAAETNMEQILFHQLERLVPLEPTSISFAWHIAERIPSRKALTASLTIVKKTTIDRAIAFAQQFDLVPSVVSIRRDDGTESIVWRGVSTQTSSLARWLHRGIEATAMVIFVLAYTVSIVRLDAERTRLTQQLKQAQTHMAVVETTTKRFTNTDALLRSVRTRLSQPTPLALLNGITKAIPLDASVSEFDFRPGQISLVGIAAHSTALLDLPLRAPMFSEAQFSAPLTAAPGGAGEHFEMTVRVRQPTP